MLGETPGVVALAILVYALGGAVFALVALNALADGVVGLLRLRAGRRAPTAAALALQAPLLNLPSALRIDRMLATAPARREMDPTCAA